MDEGLNSRVKSANRRFYDIVADVYEELDGRRTEEVVQWIGSTLKGLSEDTTGEVLLDFGCGSGVVMKCARPYFKHAYGMDISHGILKVAKKNAGPVLCGESSAIPLKDNSVDVVVCFAVVHHIFDQRSLVSEIYRVLKKGGIVYTEHDMDKAFNRRFGLLLKLYRFIFDAGRRYIRAKKEVTRELYDLSEIHSQGIDSDSILKEMKDAGFKQITRHYHWFGLSNLLNRIMGHRKYRSGFAPLVSTQGIK